MTIHRNRALSGGAAALIAAGALSLSTITPAIAAPEDPPVLTGDSATAIGATSITIDVLANDAAPEGAMIDPATLALVDETGASVPELDSELGAWSVVDGQLVFAPAEGAEGVAEATYSVTTSAGITATSTVSVTIEQPAPVEPEPEPEPAPEPEPEPEPALELEGDRIAHVFSAEAPEATIDVLANDELEGDAMLDPTTLALVDEFGQPVQELATDDGTWSIVDGQVVFAAAEGFVGAAVAEYSVATDTGETITGEVRVDATWAGTAPEVELADDSVDLPRLEDTVVDVLANDELESIPLDSETLQLIGEDGEPTDEVTTWSGTWSVVDGEIAFDGLARHKGETSIEYVLETPDGTAGATLTVNVNQLPAAALQ